MPVLEVHFGKLEARIPTDRCADSDVETVRGPWGRLDLEESFLVITGDSVIDGYRIDPTISGKI